MKKPHTLVIISGSYPYDGEAEDTFLNPEVYQLQKIFDNVILVPGARKGALKTLPDGAKVDEGLADIRKSIFAKFFRLAKVLFTPSFYKELKIALKYHSLPLAKEMMAFLSNAYATQTWARDCIKRGNLDPARTIFYTYWLGCYTMGISRLKKSFKDIILVSRVHGFDLYAERHTPPYIPFRTETLDGLNRLYTISENGRNYMIARFPEIEQRCAIARLGVLPASNAAKSSEGGWLRIISCSYLLPVKRVELLMESVRVAAKKCPQVNFIWHHIGNGEKLEWFRTETAKEKLPVNLEISFLGYLTTAEIMAFYARNPIDVFVNVSRYEGVPVSIMEAQSFSIPVIATNVGGNGEIVNNRNGFLLDSDPAPLQIAEALITFHENRSLNEANKTESLRTWHDLYSAQDNFGRFAQSLEDIFNRNEADA